MTQLFPSSNVLMQGENLFSLKTFLITKIIDLKIPAVEYLFPNLTMM